MNKKLFSKKLTVQKLNKISGNGSWRDTKGPTKVVNGCTVESSDTYYDSNGDGKMNGKEYESLLMCSSIDCGEV